MMRITQGPLHALYAREVERRGYAPDPAQLAAVAHLERLRAQLMVAERRRGRPGAKLWRKLGLARAETPKGVYLWGDVGRGKTFLLDLFHEELPIAAKRRSHFHRFMHDVHAELRRLAETPDPLTVVADRIASRARLLAFDELFVSDIADAMILGGLFRELDARGVALVFTSNVPPRGLYRDGLQRQRFVPAIELLERATEVIRIGGEVDYRLRQLTRAALYLDSAAADIDSQLGSLFETLADGAGHEQVDIEIAGRTIPARREAANAVWFDFGAICMGPRSQNDYIEIARDYHSVVVSGVPQFDATSDNAARRFIALVDELYDHGVNLGVSASAPPPALYRGRRLRFEFERTASRLIEMQSAEYLARPHRG